MADKNGSIAITAAAAAAEDRKMESIFLLPLSYSVAFCSKK